jgi:hypothetical protein
MTFEEWANRTFGSNFTIEEPITYFRMGAAWESAQKEIAEWIEPQRNDIPATGSEFSAAILLHIAGR